MNTVIMGHAMYYYGNVSAVSMATCCRITMISLPFIASQPAKQHQLWQCNYVQHSTKTVLMLYCCELFMNINPSWLTTMSEMIASLSHDYAIQQSLNTPSALRH
jgi:hypothetical protein